LSKSTLDFIDVWQDSKKTISRSGRETMDNFISKKKEYDYATVTHQTKRDAYQ
jgi:hypothetical protein